MSISQVSPNSLATTSPFVNPSAKTTAPQSGATLQTNMDAQKPVKSAKTDTVTISQQALQMTSNNNSTLGTTKNSTSSKMQSGSFFSTQA